jgi:uncharacterized membrane protein YgcG
VKKLLVAVLAAGFLHAAASEEIRSFSSQIEVLPDSDIIVTETIRVMPEGNQIKRGIYRDFPTMYSGGLGLRSAVRFELLETRRDGQPEPSRTERKSNGLRIYLGSANVFLPHVETTYTIKYRTGPQLGFFKDFDELYWNVTGNGWSFPILAASACVTLPPGAKPRSIEAYTGRTGSKGTDFQITSKAGCDVSIETTNTLSPGEGLTLVVTWPKGFVQAPPIHKKLLSAAAANFPLLAGFFGLIAATAYFLVTWILVGRDPKRGVVIPLFTPPQNFTPQETRYLDGLGTCDNTSLAAAVLNLAVKRSLTITESNKIYTLNKLNGEGLDEAESLFLKALFRSGSSLLLKQENHSTLEVAKTILANGLANRVGPQFARNSGIWTIGFLLTLASIGFTFFDASLWTGGIAVLGIALCIIFNRLLKRPTREGQKLRDQILGFKKYLSVAEADRLDLENPPERTPQLFEKFLPYALALGVEQAWSKQFTEILAAAALDPDTNTAGMNPVLPLAFATSFTSSFSDAISSASMAPGSTSGSGGGGSSGGGGGGGGGGGW